MLLSTQTELFGKKFGDEQAVRLLCEAGFDALDLSLFRLTIPEHPFNQSGYVKYVENLKQIAESYGVCFDQAHAPFPSYIHTQEDYNKQVF